jgi:hypothetical protein
MFLMQGFYYYIGLFIKTSRAREAVLGAGKNLWVFEKMFSL